MSFTVDRGDLSFTQYQTQARATEHLPSDRDKAITTLLLGLAGEAGVLLTEYKKRLRDGEAHILFKDRLREEIGDVLWYLTSLASHFEIDLAQAASENLVKTRQRFLPSSRQRQYYDNDRPINEQIPRAFEIEFREIRTEDKTRVEIYRDSAKLGDSLTDNAHKDDGYRFHDVFHLSYAAVLAWSPVARKLLRVKRKTDRWLDEVEDGGRAIVIDEAISALAFESARHHGFFERVSVIDEQLLDTIAKLTAGLEVSDQTPHDWQRAILAGFAVWRQLREYRGGIVSCNLLERTIEFRVSAEF